MLETIEINSTQQPATASIIWMHGLGADGHDFVDLVPALKLSLPIRFIFPHAPISPVTLNNGMLMRSWFDIVSLDANALQDDKHIREAATWVDALIEQEQQRGIPADRILLAGFSQGGALALYAGLRSSKKLGGIIALSTFLPIAQQLGQEGSFANKQTPIFMAHGIADPVVALAWAEASRNVLQNLHYSLQWHVYPMLHQLCEQEIHDIAAWITTQLTV